MRYVPNLLSLARIVATVPLVALILINTPTAYLWATGVFFLASITDTFDGRIARRYKLVSNLGVFLDLTADKVYVSGVLVAFTQVGVISAWITIIIITREFLVSGLRSLAAAQGMVIPAGPWGKQKTTLTLVALGGIMLGLGLGGHIGFPLGLSTGGAPHSFADYLLGLADVIMLLAVLWTIISAVDYTRGAWSLLTGLVTAPAKK